MQTLTRDFISDNYQSVDISPLATEYPTLDSINKDELINESENFQTPKLNNDEEGEIINFNKEKNYNGTKMLKL